MTAIRKLHHAAYRCRDSEETRRFYEDFLGLRLVDAFEITTTMTGRDTHVLHSFYAMADGACIAFFEAPDMPFEFRVQHDFDLHIALEVDHGTLERMLAKGRDAGIETRGVSDHGFIHSIYFRDPNGYVVELSAPVDAGDGVDREAGARERLDRWSARRADAGAGTG
jgi:catechol 2,3-dioxygenase-like lactoylglutathione lyase family enzyme